MADEGFSLWMDLDDPAVIKILYEAGWRKRQEDESRFPVTDDIVAATNYVSVPIDMKCHKCGAEAPWRDAPRNPRS
jgi:rubredoxin